MDLRNFKFDPRLDGVDQNGNLIRGKKNKKKHLRENPIEKRRREEELMEDDNESGIMRFSLSGIYYDNSEKSNRNKTHDDKDGNKSYRLLPNDSDDDENTSDTGGKNKKQNNNHQQSSLKEEIDDAIYTLSEFVSTYSNNRINTPIAKSIVANGFAKVANIMSHYSDNKWDKVMPEMNKVIILMSSENFSRILKIVFSEGIMVTTNTTKEDVMRLFNLVLDYNIDKMSNDVICNYVEIVTEYVADIDIKLMTDTYGMDEDTALNFVISIPICVTGVKSDIDIKQYSRRFIDEVLRESDSTIAYMNATCQKKLFYNIFNDKKDLGAIKAVGQCLTSSEIIIPEELGEDGVKSAPDAKKIALLNEYRIALYEILDEYDIPTIQKVLKFIVKELKRRDEAGIDVPIEFNLNAALEYENIRKAILDYTRHNSDARHYLDKDNG